VFSKQVVEVLQLRRLEACFRSLRLGFAMIFLFQDVLVFP